MRAFLVIALAIGLSACSDWDGSFYGDGGAHEATPADMPMAAAPAPVAASAPAPAPMASSTPAPMAAPETAPVRTERAATADTAPRPSGDHCAKLARARASDAAYQGEDEGTQRSVYDRTYADCMDWDAKHAL
jgi:hypothetical protein